MKQGDTPNNVEKSVYRPCTTTSIFYPVLVIAVYTLTYIELVV
jgi:hypothetical protein